MKKTIENAFSVFFILAVLVSLSSCRDDFEPTRSSGNLVFSKDTVYLDTVFSNIGSSTYRLKVYNPSDNFITIPNVGLAKAENSSYRLNIDGIAGKTFQDIEILPRDSIFIFIETTVDASQQTETNFLYTDQLVFDSNPFEQKVELVTLIQDAIFLFPKRNAQGIKETLEIGSDALGNPVSVAGFVLKDEHLRFTNTKPYVIYGYAGVAAGKTLTIDAGARLHFHQDSGIILAAGARLESNGMLSNDRNLLEHEIILEGDRLEPEYAEVPGQWGTLWFTPGSSASLNYTTIKNNTIGILADGNTGHATADVYLKNTQIYNSSVVGLYGLTGSVLGENVVVGNSGISNVWLRLGGSYEFVHCTFANYWDQSFRNTPALQIDNYLETESALLTAALTKADFVNCIIYGNNSEEISLKNTETVAFNFSFSNSLIRFDDAFESYTDLPNYNFLNPENYASVVLSQKPDFKTPSLNDYRIGISSAAAALGNTNGATQVPRDILGNERTPEVDAGAYQVTNFED